MGSESPKQDPRVQRTLDVIHKAFVELVLEKGFATVSVREVAERAGIGFKTFYRHYNNKEDILTKIIDQLAADLWAYLRAFSGTNIQDSTPLFTFVLTHQDYYRPLLDETILSYSVRALKPHAERWYVQLSADLHLTPPPNLDLLIEHWTWATLVFIRWWLVHHMDMPPQEIAALYDKLVLHPFLH